MWEWRVDDITAPETEIVTAPDAETNGDLP